MTFSLVLTGLFALSTQAAPSGWSATFPPNALPAPLSARSLVVVAVDDASKEPALALEAALRRAPKAPRVERGSRPANAAALGDRELVEASRSAGAERVAIVRAYPPSVGSEPVAVVAVYARGGEVVATFAAHRGTPIGAPAGNAPVAEVEGMDAVATYRPEREAQLKERYLGLEEGALFQSGTKVGEFNEPYQGEAKRKLEWPEFYEVVGRKDLAEKQRGFNAARTVVGFTSLGLAAAGIVGAAMLWPQEGELPILSIGAGFSGLMLGTLVYSIGGIALPTTLTTAMENRQLVHDYNQRLVRGEVSSAGAPPPGITVAIGPRGFGISGRF